MLVSDFNLQHYDCFRNICVAFNFMQPEPKVRAAVAYPSGALYFPSQINLDWYFSSMITFSKCRLDSLLDQRSACFPVRHFLSSDLPGHDPTSYQIPYLEVTSVVQRSPGSPKTKT